MKQYHICGIGNALVDFDFEVSEETLTRLNIEKGVMTLIDACQEQQLLEDLDGIKHVKACGGSAANTVLTVQSLGGKGFYSCKIADDHTGDFFLADLKRNGVATNIQSDNRETGVTGKCIAMITPDAERTMNTYLGISGSLSTAEICPKAIADATYLYAEGYLVASPTAFESVVEAIKIAKSVGTTVAFSLSDINMVRHFRPQLDTIFALGVDVLFCNHSEAKSFVDCHDFNDTLEKIRKYARDVLVTCSDKGVVGVTQAGARYDISAYPVSAIDTIGAGDIFAGAYLYAIAHDFDMPSACDIACYAASHVVTKFGPRLDKRGIIQVQQHIQKILNGDIVIRLMHDQKINK